MRKGAQVNVRTPRGPVKRGRFVQQHDTHTGVWYEVQPVDDAGKVIKNAETFRSRPTMVTLA